MADNGGNDKIHSLFQNYPIQIIQCDKIQSAAYARNEGARGFNDGILVFLDSDVVCEKYCIQNLVIPILEQTCHATIGNYSTELKGLTFTQKYKQLYIHSTYDNDKKEIKNDFWTAICAVNANVFHKLKGFDPTFKGAGGEDQEFGIRMTKNGYFTTSVQKANGQHLNPYGFYNVIHNDFRKGLTALKNSFENKVSITDNRHSKINDILSVILSFSTLFSLLTALLYSPFIIISIVFFIGWMISRISLLSVFIRYGGIIFAIKSLLFMYLLDLVRFLCVPIAIVFYKVSLTNREK